MRNIGLVLEGGGMRGSYTAGVLDFLLDENIHFEYVVGTSAGACNGSSYVARQRGRNYKVMVEYGGHPEYISYKKILTHKQLIGMDFIFDTLPNQLVPFDYESFMNRSATFIVGTTDMKTGRAHFYDDFPDNKSLLQIIRAASSLPLIAPSIRYLGKDLMDGGISDPIPIQQSIHDGNKKHVIVLTRNEQYVKPTMKWNWLFRRKFKDYPRFTHALKMRHFVYNETLKVIRELERTDQAFVIRPISPLHVSRIERNREKLHNLYQKGYEDSQLKREELLRFLSS
nr:patatin family protein [Halobacillus campisalis]